MLGKPLLACWRGSVCRRQRWTHKLLVVAAGDLFERLFVEELLIGWRQPQEPGRLPALPREALNTPRPEEQEQAGFCRIDMERVRDVARAIDDRASDRFDHGLTVLDTNLAGEDHEELVFPSVDRWIHLEPLSRGHRCAG
jgi:hypothetical protein